MKPSVQFAKRKDGITIAYSVFGNGPPLVLPPPWVTSLSLVMEDSFMNQYIGRLAET
jgi:hypothetical protein